MACDIYSMKSTSMYLITFTIYIAIIKGFKEVLWMNKFLKELG